MRIGMIGLGRMGLNMARRMARKGLSVAAWNRTFQTARELADKEPGVRAFESLEELSHALEAPRLFWMMLPAGAVVDETLQRLLPRLAAGDVVVDGGNTHFKDDARRAALLAPIGAHYVDVGTSGGVWGLSEGYCLMVGGEEKAVALLRSALDALAPEDGHMHCGPTGAGHFVKMIHNGIEYGLMQAYAEGFALLERSPYGEGLDFAALSRLWNKGSVIRSWLLELAGRAFADDPRLSAIAGHVDDSGEGRWTVQQAVESGVSAPVITLALMERFRSRTDDAFADRMLAALRREFGGHAVKPSGEGEA